MTDIATLLTEVEGKTPTVTRRELAEVHYVYGVNSGRITATDTPDSIASAVRRVEMDTCGPVKVVKILRRVEYLVTIPC